jgi:hypothetical protein
MIRAVGQSHAGVGATWAFLGAFLFACLLFWWLPSILFGFVGVDDPVEGWALWVSLLGAATFAGGYFLPPIRFRNHFPSHLLDVCEAFAYRATLWLALPALVLALQFFRYRSGVEYGQGEGLSLLHQAVFYGHMFFAFLFLGAARTIPQDRRRIIIASALVIAPRLIVSLRWGRFFLVQAVVPVLLIALARGWVTLSKKRALQFTALALFVLFVPSLTRGDNFLGQDELITFFHAGSSLGLLQDNRDLNLTGLCPPLLVSLTDKLVPYTLLNVCTMEFQGSQGIPATLDRILTEDDPATVGTLTGKGSNYLLELYLTGGIGAIILGSVIFGFTNRCFVQWISQRSLFAGIWAECLSRALFAPRSTLGYVYERIPSLLLATMIVAGVVSFLYPQVRTSFRGRGLAMRPNLKQTV